MSRRRPLAGMLRAVLPPPRRPVTVRATLPIVLVLVLFYGLCAVLEWRDVLVFTRPRMLALMLAGLWLWWLSLGGRSGLGGVRSTVALVFRLLLLALLVLILAQPRALRETDHLSVVYLLDNSASITHPATQAAMQFIASSASGKPQGDRAGLVVFGREAGVELPPGVSFPLEAINVQLDREGTNIEKGLALSAAMLSDDEPGRIVLVSDGTATEGNLTAVLEELASRRIPVDVLPIDYDYEHEVWVERLELPRSVKVGETYEAAVIVSALSAGAGDLVLRENGQEIFRDEVQYAAGKNRLVIPIYLRDPGYYEYEAVLEAKEDRDGWQRNNRAINAIYLKGEARVLVVTHPAEDPRAYQPLVEALRLGERDVEVVDAYRFPVNAPALMPYDATIFVNAPADMFAANQLEALRKAVFDQGMGFLMVGGEHSFGPGGYHRTPIEEALPVTMDIKQKKVMPKGALAIVLHTCEFPDGNWWGKQITKRAIKVLGAQDEVGVLIYDFQKGENWLFPLTPAGRYDQLVPLIEGAQIGDMPTFASTMEMGLAALKANDAAAKHMIIISDGDPSPPAPGVLQGFVDAKISVTTVAVFPHGTDTRLMQRIAVVTGGNFYFPQKADELPAIFIKEAKTLKRSLLQNIQFTPEVAMPSPVLKGIASIPPLRGYVMTTPKARARVVLETPKFEESGDRDPVLAVWRYGVGQAAAFTSDLSPNWAADWMGWERYKALVNQLVTEIARTAGAGHLQMQTHVVGHTGLVVIEDFAPQASMLELRLQVTLPDGSIEPVTVTQTAPRRYEGRFELRGTGRYELLGVGLGAGREERLLGGIAVPYSQEYLRFRASPLVLEEIAARTQGRILTGSETSEAIFGVPRQERHQSQPIFDWLLVVLACLVPLDVGLRRVQVDWSALGRWMGMFGREAPSERTFEALRERKQTVARALGPAGGATSSVADASGEAGAAMKQAVEAARDEARREATEGAGAEQQGTGAGPGVGPGAGPVADAGDAGQAGDASTTGRLLAMRRKRRDPDSQ